MTSAARAQPACTCPLRLLCGPVGLRQQAVSSVCVVLPDDFPIFQQYTSLRARGGGSHSAWARKEWPYRGGGGSGGAGKSGSGGGPGGGGEWRRRGLRSLLSCWRRRRGSQEACPAQPAPALGPPARRALQTAGPMRRARPAARERPLPGAVVRNGILPRIDQLRLRPGPFAGPGPLHTTARAAAARGRRRQTT